MSTLVRSCGVSKEWQTLKSKAEACVLGLSAEMIAIHSLNILHKFPQKTFSCSCYRVLFDSQMIKRLLRAPCLGDISYREELYYSSMPTASHVFFVQSYTPSQSSIITSNAYLLPNLTQTPSAHFSRSLNSNTLPSRPQKAPITLLISTSSPKSQTNKCRPRPPLEK
jgi:hypothetical protein